METGSGDYGCSHYKRMCKIRAPCCNKIFDCRHCHNEAEGHDIPRHEVTKVICSLCDTEQDVQQHCSNCSNCRICLGLYFCAKCKLFDDDSMNAYHCDECGICRNGGREDHFHCKKCDCCRSILFKDAHNCLERATHNNCPVCLEFLFDSTTSVAALSCGHTIHDVCLDACFEKREGGISNRYSCPICRRSIDYVWQDIEKA